MFTRDAGFHFSSAPFVICMKRWRAKLLYRAYQRNTVHSKSESRDCQFCDGEVQGDCAILTVMPSGSPLVSFGNLF